MFKQQCNLKILLLILDALLLIHCGHQLMHTQKFVHGAGADPEAICNLCLILKIVIKIML
jgi:hypothetical protein